MMLRPPQVLVVDDDQDLLASLERGLRLAGFEVRTAADGARALEQVSQGGHGRFGWCAGGNH